MAADDDTPRALVTDLRRVHGVWAVEARCPEGHLVHHGGGDGEAPYLGHRLSHCPYRRITRAAPPCTHGAYSLTLGDSPETAAFQRAASPGAHDVERLAHALRPTR